MPKIVCLDLEGVLIPEIWIAVAKKTKVKALERTTRDEPNYDKLMRYRLGILRENGIQLKDIQKVIGSLSPLPGAKAFIKKLRALYPVLILSDTFYEFATPLMKQLDYPTLFCHSLQVDTKGMISGYQLRLPSSKDAAVQSFRNLKFDVVAAGDSYNDLAMLRAANKGIFFRPPDRIVKENPDLPVVTDYSKLLRLIQTA